MRHFTKRLSGSGLRAIGLSAAFAVVVLPRAVQAQQMEDLNEGHRIAQTWCSNCHVIGPEQQRGSANGVPTFAAVAAMKTTTPMGLHAFLQTPHQRMPDLQLSRAEADDLVAYIMSLRRSPPR